MEFPEEYIKRAEEGAEFTLHSGRKSRVLYDVNAMWENAYWRAKIFESVPSGEHYVGIRTCGEKIAKAVSEIRGKPYSAISKEGVLEWGVPLKSCILIDDVATTGKSLEEALEVLKSKGIYQDDVDIFVVVDRRLESNRLLNLHAMFDVGGVG